MKIRIILETQHDEFHALARIGVRTQSEELRNEFKDKIDSAKNKREAFNPLKSMTSFINRLNGLLDKSFIIELSRLAWLDARPPKWRCVPVCRG